MINEPIHHSLSTDFKSTIRYFSDTLNYIKSKIFLVLFFSLIGLFIGWVYSSMSKEKYIAKLTFALEEEKGASGGLSNALGLANSLGIDFGGGVSGAFSGTSIIELMKSRLLVEKALLNPVTIQGSTMTLADYFLKINSKYASDKNYTLIFPLNQIRANFSFKQDSILSKISEPFLISNSIFRVFQKDKKAGIITVETTFQNELFAKLFTEFIAEEVSEFYIESKSRKAKSNLAILQRQTDSIRYELNKAIGGVAMATDNVFNLNMARQTQRVGASKQQIDVQANSSILTQLVANLEMAKVSVRRETPLIQIIDKPILPLKRIVSSKVRNSLIGFFLGLTFIITILIVKKSWVLILNKIFT